MKAIVEKYVCLLSGPRTILLITCFPNLNIICNNLFSQLYLLSKTLPISQMEPNIKPGRIHCSDRSEALLRAQAPEISTKCR